MHFFDEMFFVEGQFEITEEGKRFLMKNTFLSLLVLIFALKIVDVSAIGPGGTRTWRQRSFCLSLPYFCASRSKSWW